MVQLIFGLAFSSKCEIRSDGFCVFTNVSTTELEPYFDPTADKPNTVLKIVIESSRMPIFTNEVCEAFSNLETIEAFELGIIKIIPGALDNCKSIVYVSFWNNKLTELPANLFQNNLELKTLHLQANRLKKLDVKVFGNLNNNLETLHLGLNFLTYSSLSELPYMEKLQKLELFRNELMNLNDTDIIYKFPQLKEINIEDNFFGCKRLLKILETFRKHKTNVDQFLKSEHKRPRKHTPTIINGVDCFLDDEKQKTFPVDLSSKTNRTNYKCNDTNFLDFGMTEIILICIHILLIIMVTGNIFSIRRKIVIDESQNMPIYIMPKQRESADNFYETPLNF